MQHKAVVWILIGLATLIAFVASLTIWVDRQMLDNHAWKNASAQLIQDPEVRSTLSVYMVNSLYQNIDVAGSLAERLPKDLKPLAAPAAAALRGPAANTVGFMLARPRVQALFVAASAQAHDKLVNVLENKTGHGIATGSGVVTLNLATLVKELGTELGLPAAALAKIPADAGTVTLMKSSQLSLAQQVVRAIHVLSGWLLALVLVMYAVAVYLAHGGRRVALRAIAWMFLLVGVLLLVARKVAGNYVTHGLAPAAYQQIARIVWAIETSILGQIGWSLIFYGVVALVGVVLAGPTKPARTVRDWIAPVLNQHQAYAWSAVAGFWLLLILWGGTHALRTWWGILLIGALLAAGLEALRRQTLAEAAGETGGSPTPPPLVKTELIAK